jgi:dTDP-4-dehydrorhamnose 3,5-epimerase
LKLETRVKVHSTDIDGLLVIEPNVFQDRRGYFLEHYSKREYSKAGVDYEFVQDNQSFSKKGVLRGLHYQLGHPQAKLVRVSYGRVFDVVVDVRKTSPTYKKWFGIELSDKNNKQLLIPVGLAHGFYVFSEAAILQYKCSDFYAPSEERGIRWNDPQIAIKWPIDRSVELILSDKDAIHPSIADMAEEDLPE